MPVTGIEPSIRHNMSCVTKFPFIFFPYFEITKAPRELRALMAMIYWLTIWIVLRKERTCREAGSSFIEESYLHGDSTGSWFLEASA